MAFSLLRFGRASFSAAFERSTAVTGVVANNVSNPVETPIKQSFPTNTRRCTGDSCPIDMTMLRRNSASSGGEKGLSTSAPANYALLRRHYSRTAEKDERRKKEQEPDSDSDSDSDTECKGKERSEFWRRKMRTFHGILDVNNDGVFSFDDFQLMAKRFQDLGHLDEEQAQEFRDVVRVTWEEQWGEITPYNLVTVEQYLADMSHVLNDKSLKSRVGKFLPYLFKAVDKDKSGSISVKEFKLFFNCLGLSDETAAVSFAIIDKNCDGSLSLKEFVKLGNDFFFTEDEKRVSRMFWGPLVDH